MKYQKKEVKTKTCPKCSKDFLQKRSNQKFCSERCKDLLHIREYNKRLDRPYVKYKKDVCSFCGFIPIDMCQLDVDHIDGNHKNHDPSNLQTLCANCHRLKTKLSKEGCYKFKKG